ATEIHDVLARNICWTTWGREHFTLHGGFDFTRDLYEKLFPNASWFRMLIGSFKQILAGLAINPFSYRLNQTQNSFSYSNITNNLINHAINRTGRSVCLASRGRTNTDPALVYHAQ